MSRPGLYIMVVFCLLNSCSADEKSAKALRLLEQQFGPAPEVKRVQP